ncbi:hypothetical protein [Arabiibacter massiliensis]|uniref:hypothetical protein n=1 Tax=Arabiibacter massiliensis TaxID=1870985 RepID=UPI0009BBB051|nr:hypothetical protein [Arabiibacter massiliensis]
MAHSSPEAMARMIQNITRGVQAEQAIIAALKSDYAAIGQEWNDANYEKLGAVIDEAIRELSGNQAKLSECITSLQLLKMKLEDYLSTRF